VRDTESWVANSNDRVAAVIASMRAMGQDRTAGIYAGNAFTSEKHRVNGREHAVAQVWAPGAAVAACQHFIGQREFKEILFKHGLPWVFVFDGLRPKVGDASLVVNDNVVECAIPWTEMPEVKRRVDAGQTIKFSFRLNHGGGAFELAARRSVSKDNCFAFHNDWSTHWANELEFGFEK
jgi:hypothetical protein